MTYSESAEEEEAMTCTICGSPTIYRDGLCRYCREEQAQLVPGAPVRVNPDGPEVPARARDCTPAWIGTVVSYWRNGCWIVRGDNGTTCAYDAKRLEPVAS